MKGKMHWVNLKILKVTREAQYTLLQVTIYSATEDS